MENCRIGRGRVKGIGAIHLVVEHQPLVLEQGKLKLGELSDKRVMRQIGSAGFISDCRVGNVISFHWGWGCEVLSPRQANSLERYTRYHLKLASDTL